MSGDDTETLDDRLAKLLKLVELQSGQITKQQEQNSKLSDQISNLLSSGSGNAPTIVPKDGFNLANSLAGSMEMFQYEPEDEGTFEKWYRRYESLFAEDAKSLDDKAKVRLLLRKLGQNVFELYANSLLPAKPEEVTFADTITKLTNMFAPRLSQFRTRYNCLETQKRNGQAFTDYAALVNKNGESFDIDNLTADQFKCLLFVAGLRAPADKDYRTALLRLIDGDPKATIPKLLDECRRIGNLKADSRMVENGSSQVHVVQHHGKKNKAAGDHGRFIDRQKSTCWNCGLNHRRRDCKSPKATCVKCRGEGHIARYCGEAKNYKPRGRVNTIWSGKTESENRLHASLMIDGQEVRFLVDTGSDITILSKQTWEKMGEFPLLPCGGSAEQFSGDEINILGCWEATIEFNGSSIKNIGFVADSKNNLDLLGNAWMNALGMMDIPLRAMCNTVTMKNGGLMEQVKTCFPEVCKPGLGRCTKTKVSLKLKQNARLKFCNARPIPHHAKSIAEAEYDRLLELDVIDPISYSKTAAPMLLVKKANGKVRVCVDFSTGLNEALEMHHHPLPAPHDIFAKLADGRFFSQIDLSDAYLQLELDEESKNLVVMNTHRGLYRFKRLAFGIKSAPGIFQELMDTMLSGLNGTFAYLDDLVVLGTTEEEHKDNLWAVLGRLQEYGLRIRPEKCSFGMKTITYLGQTIDKNGRRPTMEKIRALADMPDPMNVPELRSFLGMINYYGTYVKDLHKYRGPLDKLLKKDVLWNWSTEESLAVSRIKEILLSDLALTHYNPKLDIVVAADASQYGIGCVISHRFEDGSEKAIEHASRSLTSAEKNYSQIEKEALGLVYAVKKFHKMVFGRRFTLLTDHKPLLAIFSNKKGIPVHTANRLQRWATVLLGYDFDIQYRKTTEFGQADALSRLIAARTPTKEDVVIANVTWVDGQIDKSRLPLRLEDLVEETKRDTVLQETIDMMKKGWPKKIRSAPLTPFFNRRQQLSIMENVVMLDQRVVIPETLKRKMLKQLHDGHPGMVRMKALARSIVYWPGIDKDIEDLVRRCDSCNMAAKSPVKTLLSSWDMVEDAPWSRIHIDFAGPLEGSFYLLVTDSFSKWPEIVEMKSTTATKTINVLKKMFLSHGLPDTLVSDNGPQFRSLEMKTFCEANGIQQIFAPPYHPQSNGQAERLVDTFKRSMKKLVGEGPLEKRLDKFLFIYRSSPHPGLPNQASPSELLMGRKLKSVNALVRPKPPKMVLKDTRMERQYNRQHGATMKEFSVNQLVWVKWYSRRGWEWKKATVTARTGKSTYLVLLDEADTEDVRHANQMRPRALDWNSDGLGLFDVLASGKIHVDGKRASQPIVTGTTPTTGTAEATMAPAGTTAIPQPVPLRRSTRNRKPVRKLDVNTKKKRYDYV